MQGNEFLGKYKNIVFLFITLLFVLAVLGALEFTVRSFRLTEKLDADFKFYIRSVDNDLEKIPFVREDALLMWGLKPEYKDENVVINFNGLRGRKYKKTKDKDVFRVLCLGDSNTFGWDVKESETYNAMLERRLNRELKYPNTRFEVINAGVPGYTSAQALFFYKYRGIKYNPDIVTMFIGTNDTNKRFRLSDREIMEFEVPVIFKIIQNRFLLRSAVYKVLREWFLSILKKQQPQKDALVQRVSLADFKENILELNRLCKKKKAVLILIPPILCREAGWPSEKVKEVGLYRRELETISKTYGIPMIRLRELMEGSRDSTFQYFLDAGHPNTIGHYLIMERLFNCIISNKLIESKRMPIK
ncbi:MAG: SGNH/GDSL hydrolase family protein [Elusimicrobia bacterium]|nr:SGNH/GDSL hydrolase family protein [Elusimicrobiota bacterium]